MNALTKHWKIENTKFFIGRQKLDKIHLKTDRVVLKKNTRFIARMRAKPKYKVIFFLNAG